MQNFNAQSLLVCRHLFYFYATFYARFCNMLIILTLYIFLLLKKLFIYKLFIQSNQLMKRCALTVNIIQFE